MAKTAKQREKTRIEQEIDALVDAGLMTKNDAKKLLEDFIEELKTSKDRFLAFAKQELTREAQVMKQKTKPVVKKAIKNVKKARKKTVKTKKKTTKKKTKKTSKKKSFKKKAKPKKRTAKKTKKRRR